MGGGGNLVKTAAAKSALFALYLTLLLSSPATAHASPFGTCNPCDALDTCTSRAGQWFLNGHIEAGFFANAHGQKSTYEQIGRGADLFSGNTDLLENTRLTGAQVNQVYLSMGKSVDGRRGLDIGGTIDFTWGSDAEMVQAIGMENLTGSSGDGWGTGDYYAAFAQAYAEIAYGRLNVKAGKFYAPFGIDSYKSTENFFYSWSPTMRIAPTVAGGAYATYKLNDRLSLLGGWIMPGEIGQSSKNNALLGGFIWTPGKRWNVRYTFTTGKNTSDGNDIDYFCHSLTATTQINKRLKYVFDWTLVNSNDSDPLLLPAAVAEYTLMNEVIYQHNAKWALGTRFGMLNDNWFFDGDWYTVSLGANWTPNKWLTVKPEVRYDWIDADGFLGGLLPIPTDSPFNTGTKSHQFSGGLSAVVKF